MVFHHKTRAQVRLLGPCFKTGRVDPYKLVLGDAQP
jgi:hypothetical protein